MLQTLKIRSSAGMTIDFVVPAYRKNLAGFLIGLMLRVYFRVSCISIKFFIEVASIDPFNFSSRKAPLSRLFLGLRTGME